MKYILCVVYLIFSIMGLTLMKNGSNDGSKVLFQIIGIKFTLQSILGYGCYMISFLLYTIVITKFDLSYIIPLLSGIINIIILVIGIVLFHEKFTIFSIIGGICIITGVVLMNLK